MPGDAHEFLITGQRVALRHLRERDEREWVALRRSSRAFLEPWEPAPRPGDDPFGPPGFARSRTSGDSPTVQRHVIVTLEGAPAPAGTIVGMVNLSQICGWPFLNAIMGYWVGAAHTRRGYAREGVELCVRRAFEQLDLHRVEANIIPTNAPSLALVRALGFREEGFSPEYLQIAGAWRDHTRWAMTRERWDKLHSGATG